MFHFLSVYLILIIFIITKYIFRQQEIEMKFYNFQFYIYYDNLYYYIVPLFLTVALPNGMNIPHPLLWHLPKGESLQLPTSAGPKLTLFELD